MRRTDYVTPVSELIDLLPVGLMSQSSQTEDINEIPGSWDDEAF